MSTMTKVFVVLTAVLAIALSSLFISAAAQWDNWKQLATTYQTQRDAEFAHRTNMQASLEAALAMKGDSLEEKSRALADAQSKIQTLTDDLAKSQGELARARNEALGFEAGRTKLQEILAVNTGQLKGLEEQNKALLAQNMDLQTRNTRLNGRVLELTANVTILTDQARNLQEKLAINERGRVEAPTRMAAAEPARSEVAPGVVAAVPQVKGPIYAEITESDNGYASINAGESSGVTMGMVFMIFRNGDYLAELVIDRVRPNEAGGKLRTVKGSVGKGDPVVYGLEN